MEQTTSSAWPNVLVTEYMQQTGTIAPDIEMKAMEYINLGYQKLVTFECASGGFNWWEGDDPGNAVLSALAVMMFTDTAKVAFVEDALIARTAEWLTEGQREDGSWSEEKHLHAGNETLGAGSLRATAYITWALQHANREPGAVSKALSHIKANVAGETDIYTLAMVSMALAMDNPNDATLATLLKTIHDARHEDGDHVFWSTDGNTMVNGFGNNANIEVTALVSLALMQAGAYGADVQGAINYLIASKDAQGNWGYSTQVTVLTLKALLASLSSGAPNTAATAKVLLGGEVVAEREFDDFNADVLWQVELNDQAVEGTNEVTIEYEGSGNLMYQITGAYYLPWDIAEPESASPLAIDVEYDKTQLFSGDTIHVTVTVTNSDVASTGMVMAELGLPPGFEVVTTELQQLKAQGLIQKFEKTAMQLLVYIDAVTPESSVSFGYDLVAQYPLEAAAPKSETYFYYNKASRSESGPVSLLVQ